MGALADKIMGFAELKMGWDSYGSDPIPEEVCRYAAAFAEEVLRVSEFAVLDAVPLSSGGVQVALGDAAVEFSAELGSDLIRVDWSWPTGREPQELAALLVELSNG